MPVEIRNKTTSCDLTCSRSYWKRNYLSPNISFFKKNKYLQISRYLYNGTILGARKKGAMKRVSLEPKSSYL